MTAARGANPMTSRLSQPQTGGWHFFLAALVAVAAMLGLAATASAATASGAETRIGVFNVAITESVRSAADVSAGQRQGGGLESAHVAVATGVAANTASKGTDLVPYWPPNRGAIGETTREFLYAGTKIDRYGYPGGSFVSPAGTSYTMRALPPGSASKPFTTYEVVKPFEVQSSQVAPYFGELGLGTQYELPTSVASLLRNGILREVP